MRDGATGPPEPASGGPTVGSVRARPYRVPTEGRESDGTLAWDATGLLVVDVRAEGETGIGYAYTSPRAAAAVVEDELAGVVEGRDALAPGAAWRAMGHQVRNVGRQGVVSSAMAAVDTALWDLKARLLGLPLATLMGPVHDSVPVYGSGGFTSAGPDEVAAQLGGWAEEGIGMVKMKVGRRPAEDPARLDAARDAVGDDVDLFVDANGAFHAKEALGWAWRYAEGWDVRWFEEPVSSDDREGLRFVREHGPPGMDVAAGEYGWDLFHFRDLLHAGAVDVLQADATRCGGYTGFLRVGALCEARHVPLSAHTAPALHAPVMCALAPAVHVEWFHDHVRIESMLFDGGATLEDGRLVPADAPGHGLVFREDEAERYRVGDR